MLHCPDPGTGRRARPLPADERRTALIRATLPLVREHGIDVSTRQIAAAAGVAEGTIFRVFRDKDSLIRATLEAAFHPAPVVAQLERIEPSAPLDERLTASVRIVQAWLTTVIHLMTVLRAGDAAQAKRQLRGKRRRADLIGRALTRLIEPDRGRLTVPPAQVARLLRLLMFAGSHPIIAEGRLLSAEEIVGVILDGVRNHAGPRPGRQPPC